MAEAKNTKERQAEYLKLLRQARDLLKEALAVHDAGCNKPGCLERVNVMALLGCTMDLTKREVLQFPAAFARIQLQCAEAQSKERIAAAAKRRCRKCGCTEERACVIEGVPCHWVAWDLCSGCA